MLVDSQSKRFIKKRDWLTINQYYFQSLIILDLNNK